MSEAMSNEWELLEIAEDIEQGDTIEVDEDGDTQLMVFVKYSRNKVTLRDASGGLLIFLATTLEEVEGNRYIIGKSEEELRS